MADTAAKTQEQKAPQAPIAGWLSLELAAGTLAFIACSLFPPELRPIARIAVGCALASGLAAFLAVHAGYDRGINGLLAGFVFGMFGRMILLGIGFFVSGARGHSALAFTFTFFALYLLAVGAIAYVLTRQRSLKRTA